MPLTAKERNALADFLRIGYARAAGALSDMTGHRITMAVPDVTVHAMDRITPALQEVVEGEVMCVHQLFNGPLCGNAILLFDTPAALLLTGLLTDEPQTSLDETSRDIMAEMGNILLNACLGAFGNLTRLNIKFTVPQLHVDRVQEVLQSVRIHKEDFECAMMVRTRFDVRTTDASGFLVILLAVTSLQQVLETLRKWESAP